MNRLLALTLVVLLCSCEKETTLTIPAPEIKAVINAIFEVNSPAKVYIGKTVYAMNNIEYTNSNSTVVINFDNIYDTLLYADSGIYISNNIICKPNSKYTLKVVLENFETFENVIQTPPTVHFHNYEFNPNAGTNTSGFPNKLLTVDIQDSSKQENYYMLLLESHSTNDSIDQYLEYISTSDWYSFSPIITGEGDIKRKVFSDMLFNGEKASIPMNFHLWNYEEFYDIEFVVKCYLITLSKSYYDYSKSLDQYNQSMDNIWLMNSPPQLYSNIKGAFGVAAAYNVSDSIIIYY